MLNQRRTKPLKVALLTLSIVVWPSFAAGLPSSDATLAWTSRSSGLGVGPVWEVAIDSANPRLMYAATVQGIFKTSDGGEAWAISGDLPEALAVAIAPHNPAVVFASNAERAGKTTDGGATWTEVRPNPTKLAGARAFAIDPSNPATVYAVLVREGLSKSIDGGSTFTVINAGLLSDFYYGFDSTALTIDPSSPSTLFASTWQVSKSTNGGATWWQPSTSNSIYYADALAVDPSDSRAVYAVAWNGVYQSRDGGIRWQPLQVTLPSADSPQFTDVVVDPSNSANVYVSTARAGVYRSSDRGQTWRALSDGLPHWSGFSALPFMAVHSLAIDATGKFLAAATDQGVFTLSWNDGIGLPPDLHAQRLASDPGRLPRLLEQARALNSPPPRSADAVPRVGLVFAAAGNAVGALGTYFRSDVTLVNANVLPQDVMAVWLAAGSDGTDAPSLRMTLPPRAITVADFVGKMGVSGLGALLIIGIDEHASLDPMARLAGFSRVWTAGPEGRGSVSQALPAAQIASVGGDHDAEAIGLRMDPGFRTNVGIVNLGTTAHTFSVTLTGERNAATFSVTVEPYSMRQVAAPEGDYGALTALFQINDGDSPWIAYGTSVDNITGDGWTSQAAPPK